MKHMGADYQERIQDNENLIPKDEPVFVLRAKDKLAPGLVLEWAKQLRLEGGSAEVAEMAEKQAQAMLYWQKRVLKNYPKLPDSPYNKYEEDIGE